MLILLDVAFGKNDFPESICTSPEQYGAAAGQWLGRMAAAAVVPASVNGTGLQLDFTFLRIC